MAEAAFESCQNTVKVRSPTDMVNEHAASIGTTLRGLGLRDCVNFNHRSFFGLVQSSFDIGCEQVAVMATSIDHAQRIFQCAVSAISQTTQTQVMNSNNIHVKLTDNASISCLNVEQTISARIASSSEFGAQVKTDMAALLNSMVKSMATTVQDSSRDLTTPQAQRSVMSFTSQLEQTESQATFQDIVQSSINNFQSSNDFTLEMDQNSFIGFATPDGTTGCVTIVQAIIMQVLVQNIFNATIDQVFSSSAAAEFSQEWIAAQKSFAQAPDELGSLGSALASGLIVVVVIVIIGLAIFMLVGKGPSGQSGTNTFMTGQRTGVNGRTTAIIFLVIGIFIFLFGIIALVTYISTILGAVCIIAGLAVVAIAGYMVWKAGQIASIEAANPNTTIIT